MKCIVSWWEGKVKELIWKREAIANLDSPDELNKKMTSTLRVRVDRCQRLSFTTAPSHAIQLSIYCTHTMPLKALTPYTSWWRHQLKQHWHWSPARPPSILWDLLLSGRYRFKGAKCFCAGGRHVSCWVRDVWLACSFKRPCRCISSPLKVVTIVQYDTQSTSDIGDSCQCNLSVGWLLYVFGFGLRRHKVREKDTCTSLCTKGLADWTEMYKMSFLCSCLKQIINLTDVNRAIRIRKGITKAFFYLISQDLWKLQMNTNKHWVMSENVDVKIVK